MRHPMNLLTKVAFVCIAFLFALPLVAEAPFGVDDEIAEVLQGELGELYDVIQLRRGYVVQPTQEGVGYGLIEIEEKSVLVDGKAHDRDELRNLLGDDAEILFALAGDEAALEGLENLTLRIDARKIEEARQIEENIRRQVEELQRIDSERAAELSEELKREGRRKESDKRVRMDTQVSVGSPLTIKENESAREAVVILGPLTVRGQVRGDAVVVLGNADITGHIEGGLTVIGGKVFLGPEAIIDGDITSVGGEVDQAEGAQISGGVNEVVAPVSMDVPGVDFKGWTPLGGDRGWRGFKFAGILFNTFFLAIVVGVTSLVARQRVGAVAHRARQQPWKSGLIGAVVQVLTVPAMALVSLVLLVSIVGIPVLMVLLPLSILVLVLVCVLGYAGVAAVLGRAILGMRGRPYQWASFLTVMLGLILIQVWQIVGQGLAFAGGWIHLTGLLLIAFGFILKYLAWTVGLGAVMLDRFSPLPAAVAYGSPPPPPSSGRSTSFTSSPFDSPRSPAEEPVKEPDEDREYRDVGEAGMPDNDVQPEAPDLTDDEYRDAGQDTGRSGKT